jgi:hypothetical protein
MKKILVLIALLLSACAPSRLEICQEKFDKFHCAEDSQGRLFVTPHENMNEFIDAFEIGLDIFRDNYSSEWSKEDIDNVMQISTIVFLPFDRTRDLCPCTVVAWIDKDGKYHEQANGEYIDEGGQGCFDTITTEVWVNSEFLFEDRWVAWRLDQLYFTSTMHENVHLMEWEIDNATDYAHNKHPWRWKDLLIKTQRDWKEVIDPAE